LAAAALTLNGFSGWFYEDGDFITGSENSISKMASGLSSALGRLGLENFQRAKSDAERIRPLSARIAVYLEIAKSAISGSVEEDDD
jgi:hypothetical protein